MFSYAKECPTFMHPQAARDLLKLSRARRMAFRNRRAQVAFAGMDCMEASIACRDAAERFEADVQALRARLTVQRVQA
jgi:hypothetical protein